MGRGGIDVPYMPLHVSVRRASLFAICLPLASLFAICLPLIEADKRFVQFDDLNMLPEGLWRVSLFEFDAGRILAVLLTGAPVCHLPATHLGRQKIRSVC